MYVVAKCVSMSQFLVYRDPLPLSRFLFFQWHIVLWEMNRLGTYVVLIHNGHLQLCDVQHALQIAPGLGAHMRSHQSEVQKRRPWRW